MILLVNCCGKAAQSRSIGESRKFGISNTERIPSLPMATALKSAFAGPVSGLVSMSKPVVT